MLLEFEVGNHRSFKDPVTLSLLASKQVSEYADSNVISGDRYSLLKTCAIYGANASGKSNLLSAMTFMRWFVINSSKGTQVGEAVDIHPFKLDVDTENQPSHFEVTFLMDDNRYRYGFEVDKHKVVREWLFKAQKIAEKELFLRENDEIQVFPSFSEGEGLEKNTRENALFLSVVANLNGALSTRIIRWFHRFRFMHGLYEQPYAAVSIEMLRDKEQRKQIIDIIKKADLGIEDILASETAASALPNEFLELFSEKGRTELLAEFEETKRVTVKSIHRRFKNGEPDDLVPLDFFKDESEGTRKFFNLIGPVLDSLNKGYVLVVDELEAKLHPMLTRFIVRLFHSAESNPKNAQLIFATHDTNLLHNVRFRRDQIWFTEKTREQSTDLYSLAEIKLPRGKVRKDASYEKDYFRGKYGAIPYLGAFDELFKEGEPGNGAAC